MSDTFWDWIDLIARTCVTVPGIYAYWQLVKGRLLRRDAEGMDDPVEARLARQTATLHEMQQKFLPLPMLAMLGCGMGLNIVLLAKRWLIG